MTYGIQTASRSGNKLWQDYTENNAIWTTAQLSVLYDKATELLATNAAGSIKCIAVVPFDVSVSGDVDTAHGVDVTEVNVINNGAIFHIDTRFGGDADRFVAWNISETAAQALKTYAEGLGLTDVTITPWQGINATNPTGTAVHGTYTLPTGFASLVDQHTGDSSYFSNEYTFTV